MTVCKKCGKEFDGENIYCTSCRWHMKWPDEILNAPELASRRKRSHNIKIISIDRENATAEIKATHGAQNYITTLGSCTCKDFALNHAEIPCKHILRLAEELGLFQNEYFFSGEYDYTISNSVCKTPEKSISQNNHSYDFVWRTRWEPKILNSFELTSRRKLSHKVEITSLDKENISATCKDLNNEKIYTTTLTSCTCEDFAAGFGIRPCKHILHLADELNLLSCEYDDFNEDEDGLKFNELDDSKESKEKKHLIFQKWEEKLYGFNTTEEGINFIKNLKLTVAQMKEFANAVKLRVSFAGKKAEIIENIVNNTTGHSHRQLLRWLADQIYFHKEIKECMEFLNEININVPQIMEFAKFKNIKLEGNNRNELIKSLVANTIGKTARYTGNVINIEVGVDVDKILDKFQETVIVEATENKEIPELQTLPEITSENESENKPPITDIKENSQKSNIFLRILKYFFTFAMFGFTLILMTGTIARAKIAPRELLMPALMCALGIIVAVSAKRIGVKGSPLKWLLYGTFIPVVSWMDVLMAYSKDKHFLRNLTLCIVGTVILLITILKIITP